MCHGDYIRFLVAVEADPALRKALRRASRGLLTLGDLVDFAAGHGYRFTEADIPLAAAQPVGCGAD
ncbi:putative ribosomally synthesized peptide with nif11-like leader [Azospirillum brasilense]|uniref:Putative ribosomally synthesized peptide with nif11-like leader n=1 Tax=Azospirillum brasilense TaxID=192 RepID=A0A560BV44_AZOBR|nr:Nif11-like leader peptide family natural product precursor [Azospirillum brasilense]MBK3736040.1 Nif11 family protein [Azospirillum brasilense]TWA76485.1 putative ribosomally synthesized peptide with nif11-like leader [Azospirillum brasilense]